jgi:cell wall-associated NlpC family hydrolase
MNLSLLKQYAISLIGTKYFYSGDDPISGFDCSGLACELMRAAGVVPYNFRNNAQGLASLMRSEGTPCHEEPGALAFYGKSLTEVSHVGFCLDDTTMVEAGGGDSTTIIDPVASRQNAFVRLRPIKYRRDFLFTVMPPYP